MNVPTKSIITFAIIAAAFAIGYFVAMPTYGKYTQVKAAETQALQTKSELVAQESKLESFVNDFKSKQSLTRQTNDALPLKRASIEAVLANLDNMAASSGLVISDVNLADGGVAEGGVEPNTIQSQGVTFSASGSYPAFKNFLLLLETSLRLIDIDQVSMEAGDDGSIIYTIEFTTYYQS